MPQRPMPHIHKAEVFPDISLQVLDISDNNAERPGRMSKSALALGKMLAVNQVKRSANKHSGLFLCNVAKSHSEAQDLSSDWIVLIACIAR